MEVNPTIKPTYQNCDPISLRYKLLSPTILGPITLMELLPLFADEVVAAQLINFSPKIAVKWYDFVNKLLPPAPEPLPGDRLARLKIVIDLKKGRPISQFFLASDEKCENKGEKLTFHPFEISNVSVTIHPRFAAGKKHLRLYQILIALINGFSPKTKQTKLIPKGTENTNEK